MSRPAHGPGSPPGGVLCLTRQSRTTNLREPRRLPSSRQRPIPIPAPIQHTLRGVSRPGFRPSNSITLRSCGEPGFQAPLKSQGELHPPGTPTFRDPSPSNPLEEKGGSWHRTDGVPPEPLPPSWVTKPGSQWPPSVVPPGRLQSPKIPGEKGGSCHRTDGVPPEGAVVSLLGDRTGISMASLSGATRGTTVPKNPGSQKGIVTPHRWCPPTRNRASHPGGRIGEHRHQSTGGLPGRLQSPKTPGEKGGSCHSTDGVPPEGAVASLSGTNRGIATPHCWCPRGLQSLLTLSRRMANRSAEAEHALA